MGKMREMLEMEGRDSFARRALPFSDDRDQHHQEDQIPYSTWIFLLSFS